MEISRVYPDTSASLHITITHFIDLSTNHNCDRHRFHVGPISVRYGRAGLKGVDMWMRRTASALGHNRQNEPEVCSETSSIEY